MNTTILTYQNEKHNIMLLKDFKQGQGGGQSQRPNGSLLCRRRLATLAAKEFKLKCFENVLCWLGIYYIHYTQQTARLKAYIFCKKYLLLKSKFGFFLSYVFFLFEPLAFTKLNPSFLLREEEEEMVVALPINKPLNDFHMNTPAALQAFL